jgi:hypothetical protein
LRALARFLLNVEEQLEWARTDCLRSISHPEPLQQLWWHQTQAVAQRLHDAALDAVLPESRMAQRVLDAIESWQRDTRASFGCQVGLAELTRFQYHLQAMADSLCLHASAQQDQWEETLSLH